VTEQQIEIASADGTIDGVLYVPEGATPRPAIVHLTDIGGMRAAMREMALRLAKEGYVVLQPNIFYRSGRPPLFDHVPDFASERTRARFAELAKPLTPEAIERDAAAYVSFLDGRADVSGRGMGVVGYCFSGSVALRIAAAQPDKVVAAASFHGGGLYTEAPSSPHQVLSRVRARLYFAHADQDRTMPSGAIAQLEAALEAWGGGYESELYLGARHGFTVPGGAPYDEQHAERAFAKLTELFARTLSA
jgi:carboxymethylenebutenolidase